MADQKSSSPHRKRIWLRVVLGLVIALIALVFALPTLISMGLGQGAIRSAINKSVNGTVALNDLSVGWFSGQRIKGLSITDRSGRKAVDLDVEIQSGLLGLITGSTSPITIKLAGTIDGEIREDRSTSFSDLAIPRPPNAQPPSTQNPSASQPSSPQPFKLPDMPGISVQVSALTINLTRQPENTKIAINNLTGSVDFAARDQPITIDLHGKTQADSTSGSIDITGTANGMFNASGALSLRGASAKLDVSATAVPLSLNVQALNGSVLVNKLTVNLASDDLTGRITIQTSVDAQINGQINGQMNAQMKGQPAASTNATITTQATVSNILTGDGKLTFQAATAHLNTEIRNLPYVAGDVSGTIPALTATIASDDLTKKIDLALQGETRVQGFEPSPIQGRLSIADLFTPAGAVQFAIENLTGTITGKALPTAIIQPMLSESPVVIARDLGPVVDVDAQFSSGSNRDVIVNLTGANARLEAKANVTPTGAVQGSHLLLAAPAAHPDLIRGLTNNAVSIDRPLGVTITLTSFTLPKSENPLPDYAASGTLQINGPATMQLQTADGLAPLTLQTATMKFDSPRLRESLTVNGTADVDGAAIALNETITNLFDATGAANPMNAQPVGVLKLEHAPADLIARFAPEHKSMIQSVIGSALNATITTTLNNQDLNVQLQADAKELKANIFASRSAQSVHMQTATVTLNITPEIAAQAQRDSAEPVTIQSASAVTIEFQPFDLPLTAAGQYALPSDPISAAITIGDLVVSKAPGLTGPVGLNGVAASLEFTKHRGQDWSALINGDVSLFDVRTPSSTSTPAQTLLSNVRYRINTQSVAGQMQHRLNATLADLALPEIERLVGREPGFLSDWLGSTGLMGVNWSGNELAWSAEIHTQFPNLTGNYLAALDQDILTISSRHGAFIINSKTLEKRMNAVQEPPVAGSDTAPTAAATTMRVEADVPMELEIKTLRLPMALVQNKPVADPKSAVIDLELKGGPILLATAADVRTKVRDLNILLKSSNIAEGISFTVTGKADGPPPLIQDAAASATQPASRPSSKPAQPGEIKIDGRLTQLLSTDSTLHPEAAKLQMTADVTSMPTAIADALADMQGLLVAAVGPLMNAKFVAEDFSRDTGQLDARIETTNGWLEGAVKGKEQSLRSTKSQPITAELAITPALRERLLMKIHPILADIRTTENPLRLKVPYAVIPIGGGDISKLKADVELTVGKVELDSGSTTLALLGLFERGGLKTIPGEIDPITASIRNGIVKYDKFTIRIDKYELNYLGEINLVKGTVDLKTEVPLKALGQAVRELEPYADKIIVPLVTRGKFGALKTKIDPDFDMGKAALNAGFQGGLEELLKGKGGLLGDLFENLGKKKE